MSEEWTVHNPAGSRRVIVTKDLPGSQWLDRLTGADCAVEVRWSDAVLSTSDIIDRIGDRCDGVIGQLTEDWTAELFEALAIAGGTAYSNYAVGYDNVDVASATNHGIAVGNTPGVLTETTAEMAAALTLSAGRRVVEADDYMRNGRYTGWQPGLLLGTLLNGKSVGVIGCGRIGTAYGRIMVEGFKMNLLYHDLDRSAELDGFVDDYATFLRARGESPVSATFCAGVDELLRAADVVSLHTSLTGETRHLIDAKRLASMKDDAILVNTSRGPVIDEAALVAHCRSHSEFRVGLDVFEREPEMVPGLSELPNVTIVPHIASATTWTRQAMATLAATNVAMILQDCPVWTGDEMTPFLESDSPRFIPSVVNAGALGLT